MGRTSDSVTVPPRAESVGAARRFVADRMRRAGQDDDLVDTATLLVSEVVTNAVLHAHSDVSVRVVMGRGALVEVVDASAKLPLPRRHDMESATGRGLEMVELLADDYGVTPLPEGGKVVWFTVGDIAAPATAGWVQGDTPEGAVAELLGVPIGLYEVLQEHNEALLREYELHRRHTGAEEFSAAQVAAVARARVRVATAFADALDAPGGTSLHVDVRVATPRDDLAGIELLPAVFGHADDIAARGDLLTRPALPELRLLRGWIFGQLTAQLHGGAPRAWDPAESDPEKEPAMPPAVLDVSWVRDTSRAVVVADDGNRILAVSSAAGRLLGWEPADLVGQRVTAIVPPVLREAHVTGFTRHLVTGRRGALGQELALSALHRAGHGVPVLLTLERVAAGTRTAFLGWLQAR